MGGEGSLKKHFYLFSIILNHLQNATTISLPLSIPLCLCVDACMCLAASAARWSVWQFYWSKLVNQCGSVESNYGHYFLFALWHLPTQQRHTADRDSLPRVLLTALNQMFILNSENMFKTMASSQHSLNIIDTHFVAKKCKCINGHLRKKTF